MEIGRVNIATKLPRRHAASDQVRDGFHHTRIARPEGLQLTDVLLPMNVFDGHETDEIAVFIVEVEREFDELTQALARVFGIETLRLFKRTDLAVRFLQNRFV